MVVMATIDTAAPTPVAKKGRKRSSAAAALRDERRSMSSTASSSSPFAAGRTRVSMSFIDTPRRTPLRVGDVDGEKEHSLSGPQDKKSSPSTPRDVFMGPPTSVEKRRRIHRNLSDVSRRRTLALARVDEVSSLRSDRSSLLSSLRSRHSNSPSERPMQERTAEEEEEGEVDSARDDQEEKAEGEDDDEMEEEEEEEEEDDDDDGADSQSASEDELKETQMTEAERKARAERRLTRDLVRRFSVLPRPPPSAVLREDDGIDSPVPDSPIAEEHGVKRMNNKEEDAARKSAIKIQRWWRVLKSQKKHRLEAVKHYTEMTDRDLDSAEASDTVKQQRLIGSTDTQEVPAIQAHLSDDDATRERAAIRIQRAWHQRKVRINLSMDADHSVEVARSRLAQPASDTAAHSSTGPSTPVRGPTKSSTGALDELEADNRLAPAPKTLKASTHTTTLKANCAQQRPPSSLLQPKSPNRLPNKNITVPPKNASVNQIKKTASYLSATASSLNKGRNVQSTSVATSLVSRPGAGLLQSRLPKATPGMKGTGLSGLKPGSSVPSRTAATQLTTRPESGGRLKAGQASTQHPAKPSHSSHSSSNATISKQPPKTLQRSLQIKEPQLLRSQPKTSPIDPTSKKKEIAPPAQRAEAGTGVDVETPTAGSTTLQLTPALSPHRSALSTSSADSAIMSPKLPPLAQTNTPANSNQVKANGEKTARDGLSLKAKLHDLSRLTSTSQSPAIRRLIHTSQQENIPLFPVATSDSHLGLATGTNVSTNGRMRLGALMAGSQRSPSPKKRLNPGPIPARQALGVPGGIGTGRLASRPVSPAPPQTASLPADNKGPIQDSPISRSQSNEVMEETSRELAGNSSATFSTMSLSERLNMVGMQARKAMGKERPMQSTSSIGGPIRPALKNNNSGLDDAHLHNLSGNGLYKLFPPLTAAQLSKITRANTERNGSYYSKMETYVVYKDCPRPPSPSTRISKSFGLMSSHSAASRHARAKRRSDIRKSGEGVEGEDDDDYEDDMDLQAPPEIALDGGKRRHVLGPGDSEPYFSPERHDSNGKAAVKWDKSLVVPVFRLNSPSTVRARERGLRRMILRPCASKNKVEILDPLGNHPRALETLSPSISGHRKVRVSKYVYQGETE